MRVRFGKQPKKTCSQQSRTTGMNCCWKEKGTFRPVVLDQQHQHHLEVVRNANSCVEPSPIKPGTLQGGPAKPCV